MFQDHLTLLRTTYAEMVDAVFSVQYAGNDCFVVTSLSTNMFDPTKPVVDVSLLSRKTLAPIKMLEQSSHESLRVYADTNIKVSAWLDDCSASFPIERNQDVESNYYEAMSHVYETEEWE